MVSINIFICNLSLKNMVVDHDTFLCLSEGKIDFSVHVVKEGKITALRRSGRMFEHLCNQIASLPLCSELQDCKMK